VTLPAGRVLVAGIGNIFLSDDGFGVEVVRCLRERGAPHGTDVMDFGVRAIHLAYALADGGYDLAVLVDAASRGEPPGTISLVDPELEQAAASAGPVDAHALTPDAVLGWLHRIGGTRTRVRLVVCEPVSLDDGIGLSLPVAAGVERAMALIEEVVTRERIPCA
jgi:hydrogenase maturation protease